MHTNLFKTKTWSEKKAMSQRPTQPQLITVENVRERVMKNTKEEINTHPVPILGPNGYYAPPLFDNLIWLNTKEAAFYLRISENNLRVKVNRRQVIAQRLNGRLRFKKASLDRLLELNEGV